MPSWDEIINQVESAPNGVIDITRKEYISKLAEIRVFRQVGVSCLVMYFFRV